MGGGDVSGDGKYAPSPTRSIAIPNQSGGLWEDLEFVNNRNKNEMVLVPFSSPPLFCGHGQD